MFVDSASSKKTYLTAVIHPYGTEDHEISPISAQKSTKHGGKYDEKK